MSQERPSYLSVVPDPETGGRNGHVSIVADIDAFSRWVPKPFEKSDMIPITFPVFLNPAAKLSGEVERIGNLNWLTSWITPQNLQNELPTDSNFREQVSDNLQEYNPEWITEKTVKFRTNFGITSVIIENGFYEVSTDFEIDYKEALDNRLSSHANILQGLIYAMITNRSIKLVRDYEYVLRPKQENLPGPQHLRAV